MTRNKSFYLTIITAVLGLTIASLFVGVAVYDILILIIATAGFMWIILPQVLVLGDLTGRNDLLSPFGIAPDLEAARKRVHEEPEKVKYAWDLATAKLESYLAANLSQIRWLFRASMLVMFVGFLLLIIATWLALRDPQAITPALIAGVGGIITEFIGATFIVLYRSAIEHSANYIFTLDKTSSVGVAIQILDNISSSASDETTAAVDEKIIEAKIDVARLLLQGIGSQP